MKNWVIKYNWVILLASLFFSACSNSENSSFSSGESNIILLATEKEQTAFHFYANDVFSKMIKDITCDPLLYYDVSLKEIKSDFITSYRWIHESEVEFTLATNISFQSNENLKLFKEKTVSAEDIIHSIRLFAQNSPYPQTRNFLATFTQLIAKDKNKLVINLEKSVLPQQFLLELATNEIPIIPKELKNISSPKDIIGTGIYRVDVVTDEMLRFKLFKENNHFKERRNNRFSSPDYLLIRLNISPEEQIKLWKTKAIDGLLLSDLSLFKQQFDSYASLVGNLFVRQEDEICLATLNFEKLFTSQYKAIEYVKYLLHPQLYNEKFHNKQYNVFYSTHELDLATNSPLDSLSIAFGDCPKDYTHFVKKNLHDNGIRWVQHTPADLKIFNFKTPTDHVSILNHHIFQRYVAEKFIGNERVSLEANVKLFQPVTYLLFSKKVRFLNDNFKHRNDFSVVFKDATRG